MIVMGRVLAPYGVQGWIKARAFTESPAALLAYHGWWLAGDGDTWREFTVAAARQHADLLVARLAGLDRREEAAAWCGASIGVPREALPALASGEVYLADLLGLTVVTRTGETLGRVAGLVETGAHPVLRVDGGKRPERLIPLVSAHVDTIDLAAGRITVDWRSDY